MGHACPYCDEDLSTYTDIPVNGGSVGALGSSLYVEGTFQCPNCDERLNYEAKFAGGSPS